MAHTLFNLLVVVAILIVAYWIVTRFSPDPLITKIVQVIFFLIALYIVVFKVLPLAGISV